MSKLTSKDIVICKSDSQPLSAGMSAELLQEIPEWRLIENNKMPTLKRDFPHKNFRQALAFTSAIGELAELANHHPLITTEWGKVTVSWWTHSIAGLHDNDFIMAARVDSLYLNEEFRQGK